MKELSNISDQNWARELAGLSPIKIKVRICLKCQSPFKSSGNRICHDCHMKSKNTAKISGVEII